jgi:hypothetical protein
MLKSLVLLLSLFVACVLASPINILHRAAADNIVSITDAKTFWSVQFLIFIITPNSFDVVSLLLGNIHIH